MVSLLEDLGLGSIGEFSLTGFEYWITLGINIILSTIVSGIVLLIVVGIMNRKFYEGTETGNAFLMALIVNIVNFFGVVGLLGSFLPGFISLFLPLLVWIGLTKFFFSEMSFTHVLIVAVIGYGLSIFLVPPITGIIRGFIPI